MSTMTPQGRLHLIGMSLLVTAIYAVVVVYNQTLAEKLVTGYVVFILTIFAVDEWSKRHK